MPFISSQKLFFFLRYLHFCRDVFGYVEKSLDEKAKVNFKIYGVTNWSKNYYNDHIARYLKNSKQSDKNVGQLIEHDVYYFKNLEEK